MSIGRLVLRGSIGPLFIGHGAQKLFGAFGGHGIEGTAGFFESLGLRPGRRAAMAAGVAELAGGAMVAIGALTPVATSMLIATMVTAIRKVHGKNGPWSTNGGYEYNVVTIAALATLTECGPGKPSVDDAMFPSLKGPGLAMLSLASGIAGSYVATSPAMTRTGTVTGGDGAYGPSGAEDARDMVSQAQTAPATGTPGTASTT
jgi:putative oxidoreductase